MKFEYKESPGIRITERGRRVLELLVSGMALREAEIIVNQELPLIEKEEKMSREEFGKLFKKGGHIE